MPRLWTCGPRAPAGLASLDFELPTDKTRYKLFRFTTPRGEAELTARSVSNSLLGRLELLIGLVVASLLVWGGLRVVRSGVLGWFRRPLGAILLFLIGLASLCSGIFPYLGMIVLLAGIVLLVLALVRTSNAAA